VCILPSGETQVLVDTHLIHEVTSAPAFKALNDLRLPVRFPGRTIAMVDHIAPTDKTEGPFEDPAAQNLLEHLQRYCKQHGIQLLDMGRKDRGIVHIVAPEKGISWPGSTIACGDSHTSTHGAFGAIAFGIGTTQVRDVLATQTVAINRPKVKRIQVDGKLGIGVTAKDVILTIIRLLGTAGGKGYAYELGGTVFDAFSMEERMTACNMGIEGGALYTYVNPDKTTIEYLRGKEYAPKGVDFEKAARLWLSLASGKDAVYDAIFNLDATTIEPTVTWGINPGQSVPVNGKIPFPEGTEKEKASIKEALEYMRLESGRPIVGTKVDVAFIGSCTNGRLTDLRKVAALIQRNGINVAHGVKAIVVPGSEPIRRLAEAEGLHTIFTDAGFEWRFAGCSMCLAMNPDKLVGDQLCASSSNRNFKGRQGSPTGRTMLMSPEMVVACASTGFITDLRTLKLN